MIRFEDVSMRYAKGSPFAVRGVSLEILRGEFAFVVGASGSGKSSLLRLLTMERPVTEGRVYVAGRDLTTMPYRKVPAYRRQLGTVFQDFRLLADKTVAANVAFPLHVLGRSRATIRQHVPEVLDLVGLADKARRMPHELSGGEQQRVAIARAMVNRPLVLLADEPTGNLDPDISFEIVGILDRIHRSGTTIVMATHDTSMVDHFRKRVIEISAGEIVRDEVESGYAAGMAPR